MSEPKEPQREAITAVHFGEVVIVSGVAGKDHSSVVLRRFNDESAETALIISDADGEEALSYPSSTNLGIVRVSGEESWDTEKITRGIAGRYNIIPEDEAGYANVRAIIEGYAASWIA